MIMEELVHVIQDEESVSVLLHLIGVYKIYLGIFYANRRF